MTIKNRLSDLTFSGIIDLQFQFFKDVDICRYPLVETTKKFLTSVLDINFNQASFDQIRKTFIDSSKKEDVSFDEKEFYLGVAEEYLWLVHEPKDMLIELFYQATDDVKSINSHLEFIRSEIDRIDKKKKSDGWLDGENRYYYKLLEFYKNRNEFAKSEVLNFLSEDLVAHALKECRKKIIKDPVSVFFTGRLPYQYSQGVFFSPEFCSFDVRNVTEMSNNFLDLPVASHCHLRNLFRDDKDEFYTVARDYISGKFEGVKNVLEKVTLHIENNHLVARRKDILLTILNHYKNKDFLSVVNIIPMQIEGIFHDVCLDIGIDESRLEIAPINEKLRIVQSNFTYFYYFEYYSFKFPVIRNMVAHGKLISTNLEHVAIMLMLDLLPVCELAYSDEIPVNKKIKILDRALDDDYESLVELFSYQNTEIPGFYNRSSDMERVNRKYKEAGFWEYLEGRVKSVSIENIDNSEVLKFIKKQQFPLFAESGVVTII